MRFVQLEKDLDKFIDALNRSHIQTLSLTNNKSLVPASISRLLHSLNAPDLQELHLSTCNLGPAIVRDIIAFLSSPRSRTLELLELNGNYLGAAGVTEIIVCVEKSNFTIQHLGLLANTPASASATIAEGDTVEVSKSSEESEAEERNLSYYVHDRLPDLLNQNRILTHRVRAAAEKIIAPARILLNARPPTPEETARCLLLSNPQPVFRLLDLPQELIHHIIRHCSEDPGVLSEAQFVRIRSEAEDREGMGRLRRTREERLGRLGKGDKDERVRVLAVIREEWLRKGGWDRFELNRAPEFERKL